MVRRGGKGRFEEVVVVEKEEGGRRESFALTRQVKLLFTAMGNGVAAPRG
jgi:hypothetical protein